MGLRSGLERAGFGRHSTFRNPVIATACAAAALVVDWRLGDAHALVGVWCALGFIVFAVLAVRGLAGRVADLVMPHAGRSTAGAVGLVLTIVGYLVAFFVALGMLGVSVEHLVVGGAVTGVIIGIAAQQSLGNVFAGLVLLLARPFVVGDRVRIRSGSLGGIFEGVVLGISLTYVTVETDDGVLSVPNATLLAGAVGPIPARPAEPVPPPPPPAPAPAGGPEDPAGYPSAIDGR